MKRIEVYVDAIKRERIPHGHAAGYGEGTARVIRVVEVDPRGYVDALVETAVERCRPRGDETGRDAVDIRSQHCPRNAGDVDCELSERDRFSEGEASVDRDVARSRGRIRELKLRGEAQYAVKRAVHAGGTGHECARRYGVTSCGHGAKLSRCQLHVEAVQHDCVAHVHRAGGRKPAHAGPGVVVAEGGVGDHAASRGAVEVRMTEKPAVNRQVRHEGAHVIGLEWIKPDTEIVEGDVIIQLNVS